MENVIEKVVKMFKCTRCKYEWIPRNIKEPPAKCPKCQNAYWDRPYKQPKGTQGEQA